MPGDIRLASRVSTKPLAIRFGKIVNSREFYIYKPFEWTAEAVRTGEAAKRAMDIVLGAILLVPAAPLIAAMALAVALGGGNPLYGHERVGRGGRRFRCWKIRTMHRDAAARLDGLLQVDPVCRRQWLADRKLAPDPRATRLGAFLRRTSLDELPQLWNVLVGEMSLVGPRPVTKEELPRYGAGANAYCSLRPGITGLWQVNRRPGTTYDERVAMDCTYAARRSLSRDVALLLLTLRIPFAPTGG